jgi:hypothetical protein
METKQADVMAILKLYELRRDEKMRAARAWFFTEFNPTSAADIVKLMFSGQEQSAHYRMITSYWDMASSLVNNGGIDEQLFLDANSEHLGVLAKLEPFLAEVREAFGGDATYLAHLETLVMKIPHAKQIMAGRRKLFASWAKGQQ